MELYSKLLVGILLFVLKRAHCEDEPSYCHNGFELAERFNECWKQAKFASNYAEVQKVQEVYTGEYVENYARFMCSTVKPQAMRCFQEEVVSCVESNKIMLMADESGGTCDGYKINDAFKLRIINLLVPVRADSQCFTIADKSRCYDTAVRKIDSSTVDIDRYHYVADKILAEVWDCQIRLFKNNSDICPNWQLPMLLSLQTKVMPLLFGMRLSGEQVLMLELEKRPPRPETTEKPKTCEKQDRDKVYILMRVLTQKPDTVDSSEITLEVNLDKNQRGSIIEITGRKHSHNDNNKQTSHDNKQGSGHDNKLSSSHEKNKKPSKPARGQKGRKGKTDKQGRGKESHNSEMISK